MITDYLNLFSFKEFDLKHFSNDHSQDEVKEAFTHLPDFLLEDLMGGCPRAARVFELILKGYRLKVCMTGSMLTGPNDFVNKVGNMSTSNVVCQYLYRVQYWKGVKTIIDHENSLI